MKKMSVRVFARNQAEVTAALKPDEILAVTKRGKILFIVRKPPTPQRKRLRLGQLTAELERLPMTDADGEEILKTFTREAIF